MIDVELRDDVLAWTLGADGEWTRSPEGGTVETHTALQQLTVARAAGVAASVI